MDWNSIKAWAKTLTEKVTPAFDTLKRYTKDIADFTGKQLKNAIPTISSIEAYEKLQAERKVILIGTIENSETYRELALRYVLFLKDAWAMGAKLRFIDIEKSPELASYLKIHENPTLIILSEGFEYKRFEGMEPLKSWWSDSSFYDSPHAANDAIITPSDGVDPLAPVIPWTSKNQAAITTPKKSQIRKTPPLKKAPKSSAPKAPKKRVKKVSIPIQ